MYNQLSQSEKKWNKEKDLNQWEHFYYEENYNGNRLRAREKKLLEFFDSLNLPKGSNVLELGYGAGVTSAKIYSKGFNIVGVDVSKKLQQIAIKNCNRLKTEHNNTYSFEVGNVEKLKYDDESFDCVIGLGFLQYLQKPSDCISEVKRILKPGGMFIIGQRNMYGLSSIDGPVKMIRSLMYIITNRRYELRWQDTFLIYPTTICSNLLKPFSKKMDQLNKQLIEHKNMGLVKKNAWSYNRLKKLIEEQKLEIIDFSGAGYFTKKSFISPYYFKKLDLFLQRKIDTKKSTFFRYLGNSVVFIARKN